MKTAQDFFVLKEVPCRQLMNNPPFKQIRLFIDHAFAIGDERLVLVCPERRWACMKGWQQFQRHKPARFLKLNWREDYLGKGGSPDRALAISIWESPNVSRCQCEVWSKPLELWLVKRRRRFILSSEKILRQRYFWERLPGESAREWLERSSNGSLKVPEFCPKN